MGSAMFIHRIKPLQGQVQALHESGYHEEAKRLQRVVNRVNSGHIKTVTQLNKEEEEIWKP